MSDKELLELAAKAAGYVHHVSPIDPQQYCPQHWIGWNPLVDDGDALRLAVKLKMMLDLTQLLEDTIFAGSFAGRAVQEVTEKVEHGPEAATRRAIVRAAADIGKSQAKPVESFERDPDVDEFDMIGGWS